MDLQACMTSMPLKPPTLLAHQKSFFLALLLFVEWVVLGAWQPCMLANTHVESPQEPMLQQHTGLPRLFNSLSQAYSTTPGAYVAATYRLTSAF